MPRAPKLSGVAGAAYAETQVAAVEFLAYLQSREHDFILDVVPAAVAVSEALIVIISLGCLRARQLGNVSSYVADLTQSRNRSSAGRQFSVRHTTAVVVSTVLGVIAR